MMQTQNQFLDQLARAVSDAAGAADGVRREAETVMRSQLQRLIADMELVTREEFEVVRDLAAAARKEADELRARLDALEAERGRATD
ncbi:MAG: accessory factor UbiK family protein [Pseudomonadota bacterium]